MSVPLRFPYVRRPSRRPVVPLGGVLFRNYPEFAVTITTPTGRAIRDGLLDTGADDTVCPESLAHVLGIDLTSAPDGEARGVGGQVIRVRYATVTLNVTDFRESCEWQAIVGFVPVAMPRVILGQTGFLQYFDVTLVNPFREMVLTPNGTYTGQHTVH